MLKDKKLIQKGFTIVELLIVIVVIAILAALVLNTFAGVQQKARDSDRQNDVTTIQKHLETYYTDHGSYPAVGDLSNYDGWTKTNMEGLAKDAFIPPQQTDVKLSATATPTKDQYGYVTNPATCNSPTDGSGADVTAAIPCTSYTLHWHSEAKNADNAIPSLSGQ